MKMLHYRLMCRPLSISANQLHVQDIEPFKQMMAQISTNKPKEWMLCVWTRPRDLSQTLPYSFSMYMGGIREQVSWADTSYSDSTVTSTWTLFTTDLVDLPGFECNKWTGPGTYKHYYTKQHEDE